MKREAVFEQVPNRKAPTANLSNCDCTEGVCHILPISNQDPDQPAAVSIITPHLTAVGSRLSGVVEDANSQI